MAGKQSNLHNHVEGSHFEAGGSIHIGDNIHHIYEREGQTIHVPALLTHHIPRSADHILGRDAELAQAQQHLKQNRATVLFNGIGGIGKTSVATKYMVEFAADYKHRAWITVQSNLLEAFVYNHTLLKNLHIQEAVQRLVEGQHMGQAFECVLNQLSQLPDTLVVIDNANDLTDLVDYKSLFDTVHFHCLITSRTQPQEWTVVAIDHLPPDEAVALFIRVSKMGENEPIEGVTSSHPLNTRSHPLSKSHKTIEALLEKLYFHTLLIELVAKAMALAGWSFEEVAAMIESRFIHHEDLREELLATGKHGDSLPENRKRANIEDYIWHIFENVTTLTDLSKDILRGFALLPLGKAVTRNEAKDFLAILGITDIAHPLSILTERGWLDKEHPAGQKPRYKMHPLIADVVVKHLGVSVAFAEAYIIRVAATIHYDNKNPQHHLFTIHQEKPMAERLADLFFGENTEGVSRLLDNIGGIEEELGQYQKAALLKERALAIAQTIFDQNHATIAAHQSNLANVYRHLGRYAEAAQLLEAALDSDSRNFGKDHPSVAISQSNLANVYFYLGRYDEAAQLLEAALDSDMRNFGKDHPSVAIRQSNLANVYGDLGRYAEAAQLLEAALDSDVRNFGKDHLSVATRQSNLANVYKDLGRYAEAAQLLEAALDSDSRNFGKEHPSVAIRQSNLANVYGDLGKYAEAAQLLEAALDSGIRNFGKDHPSVAAHQSNLGEVYRNLGRYAEAAQLLEAALDSDSRNFGKEHPKLAISQSNLANVYKDLGRHDDAAQLLEAALDSGIQNFGKDHPSVAISQSNLANVYKDLGRHDDAAQLLEAALDSDSRNFGKDHPSVAISQNNLAIVFYQTGRKAEAKTLWQAAYQNLLKNFGATHPHTVKVKQFSEMD